MRKPILLKGFFVLLLTGTFISFMNSSNAQELNWGQKIESASRDDPRDMALDQNGNQYVVGYYDSTITIGNEKIQRNAGGNDSLNMFVGRINNDGFARGEWLTSSNNDNIDSSDAFGYFTGAAYADGNIFIASESSGDIAFNNQSLSKGQEQRYLFIAKFDTLGNFMNMQKVAKSYLSNRPFQFTDIIANEQGELYLSGYAISKNSNDSVMLGNEVINQSDYNQPQGSETRFGYLMKLDQAFNPQWTQTYYSSNGDAVRFDAISYDPAGQLNVFGELKGPITDKNQTLSYSGSSDGTFLMQVNDAGAWQWWEVLNDFDFDPFLTSDLATSENGSIYVGAETDLNGGGTNGYFAKFKDNGSPVWEKTIGTGQNNPVSQIDVDDDNLYVGGRYSPDTLSFTSQGITIGKFDTSGSSNWYATYGDPFQQNTGANIKRLEVNDGKLFCHGIFGYNGNPARLYRVGNEQISSADFKNTMFTGAAPAGYMLRYDIRPVPCYGIDLNPDFSYREVCESDSVPFYDKTATNAYGDLKYRWEVGSNGKTFKKDTFQALLDNEPNIVQIPLKLYVTTQSGCTDSLKDDFSLLPSNTVSRFTENRGDNGEITFSANSTGYEVYNWDFGDGDTIQGQNEDATVTHTYDSNKVYDVTLTTKTKPSATCSNSYTDSVLIQSVDNSDDDDGGGNGSNVSQSNGFKNLNIFPKPFKDDFQVKYTLDQAANVNIQLYNSKGQGIQTLANERQRAGKHKITYKRGSELSQGVYNLVIEVDGLPRTFKLPKISK